MVQTGSGMCVIHVVCIEEITNKIAIGKHISEYILAVRTARRRVERSWM